MLFYVLQVPVIALYELGYIERCRIDVAKVDPGPLVAEALVADPALDPTVLAVERLST
jgi:hypothetical protein